ncbi:MAG: hypothetical protein KDL10_01200, partial [Kiritimatiellae bacterium]|nr:hypothetical protein [Kiritimatiellia bacterium]
MQKPAPHSTRPELILPGKRMAVITVLGFGVVLLVLTAVDWTLRFSWFRWQDFMVHQQKDVVIAGPDAPLVNRILPEHAGGDLTSLTGLASFNRAFEEIRPETRLRTREFGYRNDPPTVNRYYPIVVLGDSFMHIGFPSTNVFSARLEEFTGQSVYNYSYPGRGPFWSLSRFLNERRFEDRKPEVLVWGLIERDISGVAFAGMAYQVWKFLEPEDAEKTKP